MTEENYNYRTSQALLRNQFPGSGKLKIPIIPKFEAKPGDFDDLLLIGFDKTHLEDNNQLNRMVHFFLYDYRFERVWKNPDNDIEKLSRYRAVLSPDFSMYLEMQGNIVYVDYERSSWRYMSYERCLPKEDLDCYRIGGAIYQNYDIMEPYRIGKGGGSAYGGVWKPAKPEDYRLIGKPGEIKVTYKKDGTRVETKIGADGRAVTERHYTDHKQPWAHSDPHDHQIRWDAPRYGIPNFVKPHTNYWPVDYPDGAPEFKLLRRYSMNAYNTYEDNRFKTISEFKECIIRGGEVEFTWQGINYSVTSYADKISISQFYSQDTERLFDTPDEALEYMVGEDRLRDVITQVTVIERTI